jgi:uncharacterized protein
MISPVPGALTVATYSALLLSIFALWLSLPIWVGALTVAVALGYASGVLTGLAIVWIALLAGLCVVYTHLRPWPARAVTVLGIVIVVVLLGMHALPGFNNFRALNGVQLSPQAAPYSLYLNFDKTVAGILLLGMLHPPLMRRWTDWRAALKRAAPLSILNILVLVAIAIPVGYLTFDPKWTHLFWLWAPVNLFFTCLTEEAFFRGFIQRELAARVSAAWIPVGSSAILFGLAHFAGGWTYVLLATVAGAGYALIYHFTRRIEMAILAHFALNATHFLLFTYPHLRP